MENNIIMMTTLEINTAPPFSTLFPIKDKVLDEIIADMKKHSYDYAHPVVLWAGHKATVLDGHTRLKAALKLGLTKIPITLKEFSSEEDALRYAIKSQSSRRNLTDAELLNCLQELDKRKSRGENLKKATSVAFMKEGKSAKATADLLGINRGKVEKLRAIADHASDEVKEAVANGMSINQAYNETMNQRRENDDGNPVENFDTLKTTRLEAITKSFDGMIAKRLEREVQEYPELTFSKVEKDALATAIAESVRKHITTILHGDHKNAE